MMESESQLESELVAETVAFDFETPKIGNLPISDAVIEVRTLASSPMAILESPLSSFSTVTSGERSSQVAGIVTGLGRRILAEKRRLQAETDLDRAKVRKVDDNKIPCGQCQENSDDISDPVDSISIGNLDENLVRHLSVNISRLRRLIATTNSSDRSL
ncbi:hypothetical protein CHUAL_006785 [Chamberlinius hualienensis]